MDRVSWGLRKLAGLGPESSPPDAQLLALHNLGDPDALILILERHGPAVWRVCRARLPEADADDAFQATVLSFIRGAKAIRSPELLGAWLVRVAALTSRKALGRRRGESLTVEPVATRRGPAESAAAREVVAKVIAEIAQLPAKSRAIVTLCVLEGQTAREAARVLGVPVGTAVTRLAAAKALLRKRLTRLGLAPSLVILLADPLSTAGAVRHAARLAELAPTLAHEASPAILALTLTGGITMTTAKILTAIAIVGVGAGAAGWGVWQAGAEDKPKVVAEGKGAEKPKLAEPAVPANPAKPKPAELPVESNPEPLTLPELRLVEARTREVLETPLRMDYTIQKVTLGTLFGIIEARYRVNIRFDYAALQRYSSVAKFESIIGPESKPLEIVFRGEFRSPGATNRELLEDVLAQTLHAPLALHVRGNQILIGPAYTPLLADSATAKGAGVEGQGAIVSEQLNGPPVSVAFNNRTLPEIVEELHLRTGENIVLKPLFGKGAGGKLPTVTATFDNVRLATVLKIVADMMNIKVEKIGNVFYIQSTGGFIG